MPMSNVTFPQLVDEIAHPGSERSGKQRRIITAVDRKVIVFARGEADLSCVIVSKDGRNLVAT